MLFRQIRSWKIGFFQLLIGLMLVNVSEIIEIESVVAQNQVDRQQQSPIRVKKKNSLVIPYSPIRTDSSSVAVRSQFNLGLDLFDATVTEVGTDGLFWSWQRQTQWLKKLNNLLLVSSLNIQLTDDKLLPIEQITLGGTTSVRGYRQNLSLGDNGVIGNLELQIPIAESQKWSLDLIRLAAVGTIWNNSAEIINTHTLEST